MPNETVSPIQLVNGTQHISFLLRILEITYYIPLCSLLKFNACFNISGLLYLLYLFIAVLI